MSDSTLPAASLDRAADWLLTADALLIAAGAGMGVDSGLPDFRGNDGFWKAYPPFRKLGLSFSDLASPEWFRHDPELAWGFYGHRLDLYRRTEPHAGFGILRRWAERMPAGYFVFTSNVDGHFGKAGFADERVKECHGSIHHLQDVGKPNGDIWPAGDLEIRVDEETMRAAGPLPAGSDGKRLARPNILMFGDWEWNERRTEKQSHRFQQWLAELRRPARLVIVELGAGTAVPTVRMLSERLVRMANAKLVRINPREPDVPEGQVGLAGGSLAVLRELDDRVG